MSNVIILHGKPDKWELYDPNVPLPGDDHWYPWLHKQLAMNDIEACRPNVVRAFEADFETWKKEVSRFDINEQTVVVAHSCGGGFFLRWLSENRDVRLKKLVLVAPWLDPLNFMPENFGFDLFDFEPDSDLINRIDCLIFHSDDDMESIQKSLDEIKSYWPEINIRVFHQYGHFCKQNLSGGIFPELLDEILESI
ncbi:MAG: alpha/beta hydrolase [Acidimicrobiia bacterium]